MPQEKLEQKNIRFELPPNLTPEELELLKGRMGREEMAELFKDGIKKEGAFSQKYTIKDDGTLRDKTEGPPFFPYDTIDAWNMKIEDLYSELKKIQQEHSEFDVSFENDPQGQWVNYTVKEKNNNE